MAQTVALQRVAALRLVLLRVDRRRQAAAKYMHPAPMLALQIAPRVALR